MNTKNIGYLQWKKRLVFWSIYIFILVFSTLLIGEIVSRILPLFSGPYQSFKFRKYDPDLGISLIPNSIGPHHRGCFKGKIKINQWGMRDRDRNITKGEGQFRIALIGDSIIEAVQVKPEEVVNILMEEELARRGYDNVEVLNFGIGSIGTTQEFLLYKKRIRRFKPDLVILLFVTHNDILNNSSIIQPKSYGIHKCYAPYFDLDPNGQLVFREVQKRPMNRLFSFLDEYFKLPYYVERIWARANFGQESWQGMPLMWGVYADELNKDWEDAWIITEKVLGLFNRNVKADGAQFIVLVIPEFFEIDPDWQKQIVKEGKKIPKWFKPFKSRERLNQTAERQNLILDYLFPYFHSYQSQHDLKWPYFSFTCDGHFSALGHQVLANAVLDKIEEYKLLPLSN